MKSSLLSHLDEIIFCFRLQQSGIAVKFITNATKESKSGLHNKLTRLGFDIKHDEIFTSLTAARRLVEMENLRPFCLLQDEAMEDFAGLDMTNPNAVVVGLAPDYFNYEHLNKAFRCVMFIKINIFGFLDLTYYIPYLEKS